MASDFCRGYPPPYDELVTRYPGTDTYPTNDFRTEWGPIFHRGRLDGSARVLVLGQDPAAHEAITRRILVGEAGQRTQGFLAKVGIDRSYVLINTFLYSVYGQAGGERHRNDPAIADYRHRWLDILTANNPLDAIVTLGGLADIAYRTWKTTDTGHADTTPRFGITHPTFPESAAAAGNATKAEAMQAMLENWNRALPGLHDAVTHPDTPRTLTLYATALAPGDLVVIPEADLPPGLPPWMRGLDAWAERTGADAATRRVTITVKIPKAGRPIGG